MNTLAQKKLLVGVTGGIAAYKSPELVRRLRERGADVRVVMTAAAREFITPLTLQAVSGWPVRADLFDPAAEAAMGHIELARWADAIVVAPATADFIARLAHGRADDLLSTVCLTTRSRLLVAPAMNQQMWAAAATQANVEILSRRGVRMLGPDAGPQACGEVGPGRLLEPDVLAAAIAGQFRAPRFAGVRVVVTAGPTREPIDPVRYITNRSSGKMGYAVAEAFAEAGAEVTLVSGPAGLPAPSGVALVRVETAEEMAAAVCAHMDGAQVFVGAAAVADYRAAEVASQKIKKTAEAMSLALIKTPDILASVARRTPRPFVVGFAAETEQLIENARKKLESKHLDMIAANDVSLTGLGFESERNALQVIWKTGEASLPAARKGELARDLVELIGERYFEKNRAENS
ncbi:MAG: Coenzyme A biosynthesis bifunctional protein CoaBC [Gammaproteobacteria bacterium]|nr:Coenzyme A biosynthesis bifunctional protein CoaBC [Gammaproteobacteria bacterium]